MPASAAAHVQEKLLRGELHSVRPAGDRAQGTVVLDVPVPRLLDSRPYRCGTCRQQGRGGRKRFCFVAADIQALCPGARTWKEPLSASGRRRHARKHVASPTF
eukprot:13107359-Alexandrium_andersonii.AAC.1